MGDAGHQGIDGVYYNPNGNPPYIIAEAKYNKARLGKTKDGKQMNERWIDRRLENAVGEEHIAAIRMPWNLAIFKAICLILSKMDILLSIN